MAYSKIHQSNLSDEIEQQREYLLLQATFRPDEQRSPKHKLAKQSHTSRLLREAMPTQEIKKLL